MSTESLITIGIASVGAFWVVINLAIKNNYAQNRVKELEKEIEKKDKEIEKLTEAIELLK